jgi:structure-specific endonuclease subunit SLX1
MTEPKPSYVYCLVCTNGNTYVGATVDLEKRLRQHNGEITGGAKATTCQLKKGHTWSRACHVRNFPDWSGALQFEWRWKQLSRRERAKIPMDRRRIALEKLLAMERPTTAAVPYAEWTVQPEVVWETECDNLGVK